LFACDFFEALLIKNSTVDAFCKWSTLERNEELKKKIESELLLGTGFSRK